jgi:ABC-type branched-subunit amino acid transport system ATPase component
VSFGGVRALQGVSLTVPSGSFVGLIGPNGAGKTTLFDVVSGLQRPERGTVSLFGEDVTQRPAWHRSRLGLTRTFQTPRVMPDLSVADNLLAGSYLRSDGGLLATVAGWPAAWRTVRRAEEAAWALAQLLEIDAYWEELAGSLHFSVRRRIEIGRVLLSGPRMLLLDEPGAGLDPVTTARLFQLLKELHQSLHLTVLLVEHYVPVVVETCDVIHVLDEGRILASGTPDEIVRHAGVRDRYLGGDHPDLVVGGA